MRYKSQMIQFNFPEFLIQTGKSITDVAKDLGIPNDSLQKMFARGSIKPKILGNLRFHYGDKVINKLIIKKRGS